MEEAKFEQLQGKMLAIIKQIEDEELFFETVEGETYKLCHHQDCCESVTIDDICGELEDLIGDPILVAEEVIHDLKNPIGVQKKEGQESFTWTFYKLETKKGGVTIRWYGDSNGFYSEKVDFYRVS